MIYKPPSIAPTLGGEFAADYTGPLAKVEPGHSARRYTSEAAVRLADIETHRMALYSCLETTNVLVGIAQKTSKLEDICDVYVVEDVLWAGLLVAYARCFDGRLPNPLLARDYLTSSELDSHDILIELRHKHAAHDINRYRSSVMIAED